LFGRIAEPVDRLAPEKLFENMRKNNEGRDA